MTTEHESDGFERALKLAEERKFDELLEHLRVDDPRYGRLVDTCVRDERLLPVCARAGVPALDVIELLVEHGASKRDLFRSAAYNSQVDLLEAACVRKWHDDDTYPEILTAAADGGAQLGNDSAVRDVFQWLTIARWKHFGGYRGYDEDALCMLVEAFTDVLRGECVSAGDFIMNNVEYLGFDESTLKWKGISLNIVEILVEDGAVKSLDFLCKRFGEDILRIVEHVIEHGSSVDFYNTGTGWEWARHTEIERWLKAKRIKDHKHHLMNAMATLDTVKDRLPEGAFLQIVTSLQGAYKGM